MDGLIKPKLAIYSFSRIVMPEDKAFFTSNNSCDRTSTFGVSTSSLTIGKKGVSLKLAQRSAIRYRNGRI
jgi:hypothetical protein